MDFNDAMNHRFACRKYQPKQIEASKLESILNFGRLTPTSFGLEGWAFHVVEGDKREALWAASYRQDCVLSAPLSVVLCAMRGHLFDPYGPLVEQRATRFGNLQEFIEDYQGFYAMMKDNGTLDDWAKRQCYLAGANMMTGAKSLGIDSIALEGFDPDMVLKVLCLSPDLWQVALVIPFGYAAESERAKIREPLSSLVVRH